MPFLPATGVEKEGEIKRNFWQRRVREGCYYIKINRDDIGKQNTAWQNVTW